MDTLLKAENKEMLTKVLTAHVVGEKMSANDLMRKARRGGGRYNLQTVSGDNLTIQLKGSKLYVIDESGSAARITIADVNPSNGVIHVANGVSVPR